MSLTLHNQMRLSISWLIHLFFIHIYFFLSPFYKVVVSIALLGVPASASLPFPSGLVLVLISENNKTHQYLYN